MIHNVLFARAVFIEGAERTRSVSDFWFNSVDMLRLLCMRGFGVTLLRLLSIDLKGTLAHPATYNDLVSASD